jgi:phage shock protein A
MARLIPHPRREEAAAMSSIAHRIAALFRIKANKALDKAEDPREVLDYS